MPSRRDTKARETAGEGKVGHYELMSAEKAAEWEEWARDGQEEEKKEKKERKKERG